MKRFVVKPALQLGKRVEPQTAAVDDGEARLDVPLEVADAHTQRCRRLLLIERQTGHLPMGRFPVGVGHAVQTYALRDRLIERKITSTTEAPQTLPSRSSGRRSS